MSALAGEWPDPDRRDDALDRVAAVVKHADIALRRGDRARAARELAAEANPGVRLSFGEERALQAASFGLAASEIADVYGLSHFTISEQLAAARRRLAAKNTTHAVAIALREGLIQ